MLGVKYSLNGSTIRGTRVLRQIEVAARAGYGGIELWFEDIDAHLASGGTLADLRRALDAGGLTVPTCIYLGGWFDAPDANWDHVRNECAHRLDQASVLAAEHVIAGPPMGRADPALGAQRYRKLLEIGERTGSLPAFEFLGFVEQFNTIESAVEVLALAAHPAGTIVIDPFHIFRGGGSVESISKLRGGQIAVAHFNDIPAKPPRPQQQDSHRVWPGEGQFDLPRFLALLRMIGYQGWLSLELFREDLWKRDPLEVARIGLEKMRAVVEA
jgi:sugar phosphate isomerase/epimerase